MIRQLKPDRKQFLLPMLAEEVISVPVDRQKELECALADLLLDVATTELGESNEGGSR
jgi:hypothetical protein